jgi:hypothetical protein
VAFLALLFVWSAARQPLMLEEFESVWLGGSCWNSGPSEVSYDRENALAPGGGGNLTPLGNGEYPAQDNASHSLSCSIDWTRGIVFASSWRTWEDARDRSEDVLRMDQFQASHLNKDTQPCLHEGSGAITPYQADPQFALRHGACKAGLKHLQLCCSDSELQGPLLRMTSLYTVLR